MAEIEYRTVPCVQCPWRRDADLALFSEKDFAMLRRNNGGPGAEAPIGTPAMACHLDQPDTAHALRRCAGWLAVVGHHHLGVRVEVMTEKLPVDSLEPKENWPALYKSLDEMLRRRPRS